MITSNGTFVQVVTAAEAAAAYKANPYNKMETLKADLMDGITRAMLCGSPSYSYFGYRNKLEQPVIDWLVSLGYLVWHHSPYDGSGRKQYTYSIYWAFPDDATVAPFAPGERFDEGYSDAESTV